MKVWPRTQPHPCRYRNSGIRKTRGRDDRVADEDRGMASPCGRLDVPRCSPCPRGAALRRPLSRARRSLPRPWPMGRKEEVGVVAVHDRSHMDACVGERGAEGVERRKRRDAPNEVARHRPNELGRAEFAVAEVVSRRHDEGGNECERALEYARADFGAFSLGRQCSKDNENRERRQEQPVGGSIENAPPDQGADEGKPTRVGSRWHGAEGDDGADEREHEAEAEGPRPATREQVAERLAGIAGPSDEQASDEQEVDAVIEVARKAEEVGEKEGDEKAPNKSEREPSQVASRRGFGVSGGCSRHLALLERLGASSARS